MGYKYKATTSYLTGFPNGSNLGSTVTCVGEKSTVILYTTFINHHAQPPAIITNRDPNRDKQLCDSTSNDTDQYHNDSSNLLTPYIESSLDRLGLLSSTHDQRSHQQTGQITFQPVLINKSKFLKATHRTKIKKIEIPRSMVVEALS